MRFNERHPNGDLNWLQDDGSRRPFRTSELLKLSAPRTESQKLKEITDFDSLRKVWSEIFRVRVGSGMIGASSYSADGTSKAKLWKLDADGKPTGDAVEITLYPIKEESIDERVQRVLSEKNKLIIEATGDQS